MRGASAYLRLAGLVWLAATPLASSAAGRAATIQRIRSASGTGYTRIVIDLSLVTSYKYAMLAADPRHKLPRRFYIDLAGTRLDPLSGFEIPVDDHRVTRVRTGQFASRTARVVVDLKAPVKPKVFALDRPPRIVIDLQGTGAQAAPPARTASTGRAAAKAALPAASRHRPRIVVDPGHGGKDPGAKGYRGGREKDLVSDIARRLANKLRARLRAQVFLTRDKDRYVPLAERKDLANRVEADIFVSIHANASRNSGLYGIETYYLKNTNDRATLRLARLENGVDLLIKGRDVSTDADLPYILSDMVQGQKEVDSILLAGHMQKQLVEYLKPRYHSVTSLGVKQGPFLVLDGTYMPAVLIETGFITNSIEGRRLAMASYREAVAEGLYRGIRGYFADDRAGLPR